MAIPKYKVINKNLDAVINYALNGEKTENGIRYQYFFSREEEK